MTEAFAKQIETEARQAMTELVAAAKLKKGDVLVVGCSSSEMVGGHIGKDATDYLYIQGEAVKTYTSPRYATENTHGTGCTFSAVITAELAKGKSIEDAVYVGKQFISTAIRENPELGKGHGPVNHVAYKD